MSAECWVLDVGQGTSQVILLPNGNAVIVDCATATGADALIDLLEKHLRGDIEVLVLSHSHKDHVAGITKLLNAYGPRIKRLRLVHDRDLRANELLEAIVTAQNEKRLLVEIEPLTTISGVPEQVFHDPRAQLEVVLLSPTYQATLEHFGNPNRLSGILMIRPLNVKQGPGTVVLGGDALFDAWSDLHIALKTETIECDVFVVPHHGSAQKDANVLFNDYVKCKQAVVSVGTDNTYGHPQSDTLRALKNSGACIMCTQVTAKERENGYLGCCDDLGAVGIGIMVPIEPSRSLIHARRKEAKAQALEGSQRHVACAGTIIIELHSDRATINQLDQHRETILHKKSQGLLSPMCLP